MKNDVKEKIKKIVNMIPRDDEWEKEYGDKSYWDVFIDLIVSLLSQQRKEIKEMCEGMKKTGWYKGCGYCPDCDNEEHECTCKGYNKALSDVISLLEKHDRRTNKT